MIARVLMPHEMEKDRCRRRVFGLCMGGGGGSEQRMLPAVVWSLVAEFLGLRLPSNRLSSAVELAVFAEHEAYLCYVAGQDADDWESYLDDLESAADVWSDAFGDCCESEVSYSDLSEGDEEEYASSGSSSGSGSTYAPRMGSLEVPAL